MSAIYLPNDARLTDDLERRLLRQVASQQDRFNLFFSGIKGARKGLVKVYNFAKDVARIYKEVSDDIAAARNAPEYIGR